MEIVKPSIVPSVSYPSDHTKRDSQRSALKGLIDRRTFSASVKVTSFVIYLAVISFFGSAQEIPEDGEPGAREAVSLDYFFEKEVRPIMKAHCFHCHGEEAEKGGGLDLRLVRLILKGGDSGPAIEKQSWESSLLLQRIQSDEMPPGPKKLSPEEKGRVAKWLSLGAKTARPEPDTPEEVRFTEEERRHWAFQPIRSASQILKESGLVDADQMAVSDVIDALVAARAKQAGLEIAESADRAVLLRRLSFNLTGLPPTPDELATFIQDESNQAYDREVERLLNSPQYGVRWARHWLDVAGYSESEGQIVADRERPHAWRYRDYVIDALNRDLPYSQFIQEQLAGDQMITEPIDRNNDEHARLVAATGFLQMAPDLSETENTVMVRNQAVADTIQTITSSILGLTVACAQCHDHRYDPISIEDYYRLRAIFDPAMPLQQWKQPSQRLTDLTNDATNEERARIEANAVALQEDINARRRAHCQTIQDREINASPENLRDSLRKAVQTPAAEQSADQKALLESHPKVRTIEWIIGQLVEYDGPAHRAFQEEEKKVQEIRESKPIARLVMSTKDYSPDVKSNVFFRGNPESPLQEVSPSELGILSQNKGPDSSTAIPKEKRRLIYAQSLTDGSHPLVARVLVNRVWQHHFGAGIVRTPGDFGLNGQRPTHPELLDFLADEFMNHGWSLKWLHKQIVNSKTFQQASSKPKFKNPIDTSSTEGVNDCWRMDPENRFLARMSLRRLDAEAVRDAILSVSGQLNDALGGPSVPIAEDDEGKAVIGSRLLRDGLFAGIKDPGAQGKRRSIFLSSQRSLQLNLLQTFDLPEMKPNCQQRNVSTVTPQALLLMNDAWVVEAAEKMSERICSSFSDADERIQRAFVLSFSVGANPAELETCKSFVLEQTEFFRNDPDDKWQTLIKEQPDAPERRALATLCQMLMASNRFLYLE